MTTKKEPLYDGYLTETELLIGLRKMFPNTYVESRKWIGSSKWTAAIGTVPSDVIPRVVISLDEPNVYTDIRMMHHRGRMFEMMAQYPTHIVNIPYFIPLTRTAIAHYFPKAVLDDIGYVDGDWAEPVVPDSVFYAPDRSPLSYNILGLQLFCQQIANLPSDVANTVMRILGMKKMPHSGIPHELLVSAWDEVIFAVQRGFI